MLALATCFGLSPMLVEAAGLGRISVQSALGQPLVAEIELNATRDELAGMVARVAAPDAFRLAGIEYASTLSALKFSIDKRPSGQPIIRVTSDRPVSDPFVDMLIELTWPAGRLVREYTFLLDPPEMVARQAPAVVAPPTRVDKVEPKVVAPVAPPAAAAPAGPEVKPVQERKVAEAERKAEPAAAAYTVKRGDTLRKIAGEVRPEGVSLDQMVVGLFRANKDAFDGNNMNRLRTGKILNVPAAAELAAVPDKEARKEIVVQASDWNAYRQKLAGVVAQAPAQESAAKQEAAGKITAKVETKAPAVEAKDQVKVSKTETPATAPATAKKPGEEDKVAKEKALKEAQERVAALEKNVGDLQKMVDLKNQTLADAQKQAAAKPAADGKKPEPATKPAEVKPADAKKPDAAPAKPADAKPADAKPADAKPADAKPADAKPADAKPADAKPADAKPADAKPADAKPADAKPADAPKPKPKPKLPPPPPPEPTFLEEFGGMLAGLVGALVAMVGGFVFWKRRKQASSESRPLAVNTLSQPSLGANSVFRATGGQSVDTSNVAPATTDFSQAGPGMIDTDEVDPVAEAEVYMAYGRDAQAEEILLEALQKDSKRLAIHVKLLQIYSNRKAVKQFETLASELYGQTNGAGPEWESAAQMGMRLDPANPLYSRGDTGATEKTGRFDSESTLVSASPAAMASTVVMAAAAPVADAVPPEAAPEAAAEPSAGAALDFDLGFEAVPAAEAPAIAPEEKVSFDFDLGGPAPAANAPAPDMVTAPPDQMDNAVLSNVASSFTPDGTIIQESSGAPAAAEVPAVDFSLPDIDLSLPAAAAAPEAPVEPAPDSGGLDFDLGFGSAPAAPVAAAEPAAGGEVIDIGASGMPEMDFDIRLTDSVIEAPKPQSVDLSSISLDLGAGSSADQGEVSFDKTMLMSPSDMAGNDSAEVATKLDLAKAYEEMGDHEGARELLQEVLNEGNADQKASAQAMLAKLG